MRNRSLNTRPAYSSDRIIDLGGETSLMPGEGLRERILSTAILDERLYGIRLEEDEVNGLDEEEDT